MRRILDSGILDRFEPRHARDIASSDLAVGGETLDRDLTDFDIWKEFGAFGR